MRWRAAAAALWAAGCTADFDVFTPAADAGTDAGASDAPGSDAPKPDGGPADAGGDAGDAGCACITAAAACAQDCGAQEQSCTNACSSTACKKACQDTQKTCLTQCDQVCNDCVTDAGCASASACSTATGH